MSNWSQWERGPPIDRSTDSPGVVEARLNSSGLVYVIDDDVHVRGGLANLFESVGLQAEAFATTTEFQQACTTTYLSALSWTCDCKDSAGSTFNLSSVPQTLTFPSLLSLDMPTSQ